VTTPEFTDGRVRLAEHDPSWAARYAELAGAVREALGERVLLLEHCGSTSVPGLAAKPVIDMLLLVADPADEAAYVPDLEAAGFPFRLREPEWHEHRLFRRVDPRANLHVFGPGSPEAERMLLFRDRLRDHPEERDAYERAKRELAEQTWEQVQDYADAKSDVVEGIIARGRREAGQEA
jgi:GrpB-like predicted nucleotidyltransferase (UPF0157 family)